MFGDIGDDDMVLAAAAAGIDIRVGDVALLGQGSGLLYRTLLISIISHSCAASLFLQGELPRGLAGSTS